MTATLTETADEQVWSFRGREVTQLIIDPAAFRFQTWTLDGAAEVRVNVPFTFRPAGGDPATLDPEHARELAPTLGLLGVGLERIGVQRTGELRIDFADGSVLEVSPHPAYEAWEVSGVDSLAALGYLCGPGGGSPWG
jgi:hypothetical protein